MPDGVDLDAGRLDRLLDGLVDRAEEARSYWSEAWKRHEAAARFEGQPFEADPMEELAGLLIEAVEHADAAYELVNEATTAYWERHPEEDDDDAAEDEP